MPKKTWGEWWEGTLTKRLIVDPIVSAATLPGDVYSGRVDPRSDEAIERSFDLAGTVGLGGVGGVAGAGPALGSGVTRRVAAELPMDEAARMGRAKDMGFHPDMRLYHGTAGDVSAFDLSRGAATSGAAPGRLGVWTALDPKIADEFAEKAAGNSRGGQSVLPLVHRAEKPAVLRLDGTETNEDIAATVAQAWDDDFDAILMRNYTSPGGKSGDILVVKDPAQLRSPHAKFDPAKRNSPDILAAGGPGGAIAGIGITAADSRLDDDALALVERFGVAGPVLTALGISQAIPDRVQAQQ